ncbi:class I SAM-dependent methyltransferase [Paenibacillus harenae]|uniref:class I SAM-dependent methyltransferase n=1 Tax=Paenibacillus harenae TaxID=306543 RepID=UPI00041AED7E|nr:class I SAM-dependent methyltransferase [Paenibacillus harenae]
MTLPFDKNLSHLGWEEVKKRQLHRLPLADEWIDIVQMKPGHSVLDIGPGPGVFTIRYAEAVGDTGRITVLEKSREAIEYLVKYVSLLNFQIRVLIGDAEKTDLTGLSPFHIIMLTDILHHTDSPTKLLKNIYENIPQKNTRVLISEFDPTSKGKFGPPLDKRLGDEYLLEIVKNIGFTVISSNKQLFEHYYIVIEK